MFDSGSQSSGLRLRVVVFGVAIALIAAIIVWTGQTTWLRTGELRERLTAVQLKSFQIADKFQQSIWELNNIVLRYGVYHDPKDWERFNILSQELDKWIDDQRAILPEENERRILDHINTTYDGYLLAARQIQSKTSLESGPAPLQQFANFESQSQELQSLGIKLAGAHGESMETFLAESKKALTYLRF